MKRTPCLRAVLALTILFAPVAISAGENIPPSPLLEQLIEIALTENSGLKASENRLQIFENKIPPAGSFNDPTLSFGLSNYPVDTLNDNQTPMTGKSIKLSQAFPFPGKLAAREMAAEQQAQWYQGMLADNRLQVIRKIKESYYSLYSLNKAILITEKNISLLKDFIRLTETSYETGKGLQQDVLRAQMEHAVLIDRLYTFRQQHQSALAEMERTLNQSLPFSLSDLPDFNFPDLPPSSADLEQTAEENRPLLSSYQAVIRQYQAQKELAKLDFNPDLKVGLAYTFRERTAADRGTDFVGIELGMYLPVYRAKRNAAVAEAEAGRRMAIEQYRDIQTTILFNIHDEYSRLEKAYAQFNLYKSGILPLARQNFEAVLSGYQVGKNSFLALLESQKAVNNYEMEYYRALAEGQRSWARLEAETGMALSTSPVQQESNALDQIQN